MNDTKILRWTIDAPHTAETIARLEGMTAALECLDPDRQLSNAEIERIDALSLAVKNDYLARVKFIPEPAP